MIYMFYTQNFVINSYMILKISENKFNVLNLTLYLLKHMINLIILLSSVYNIKMLKTNVIYLKFYAEFRYDT